MVGRVDVARRAGVSPAVVSYVLNGSHPVADHTRARVETAIRELAYRPNAVARSLALSRSHTLGLLVPDLANPHFAQLAAAIEDAALAAGLAVLLGNGAGDVARERDYVSAFRDRQVDCVIAVFGLEFETSWHEICERNLPAVALDRLPAGFEIPSVVVDNMGGARLATEHLIAHGRRHIACLTGNAQFSAARDRARGWYDAIAAHGQARSTPLMHAHPLLSFSQFTVEAGYTSTIALLTEIPEVDAIFVASDLQAVGVLRALADLGREVGKDIAVVAFDGTQLSDYTTPRLTTLTHPYDRIAAEAVGILSRIIEAPDNAPCLAHVVLPMTLTVRDTCGCGPPGISPQRALRH